MNESCMNSIHLDTLRREEFRRARAVLFGSIGDRTLQAAAPVTGDANSVDDRTYNSLSAPAAITGDFVLKENSTIYPLKVGLNTVGRLSDNDVVLPDPYLSRRHCAILIHTTNGCELHDVASKNGTFLNGRKIAGPTPIVSGDEIRICDRQLLFVRKTDLNNQSDVEQTMVG